MLKTGGRARAHAGFSLTELLTASALGLFLMSGIAFMMFECAKASRQALLEAQLRQALVTMMSVIGGELRRAGYWHRAGLAPGSVIGNAYTPVHLLASDCLLYSYDQEGNNAGSIPDTGDRHGLRLSGGALQIKTSDTSCGAAPCTSCNSGNWLALNDPQTVTMTGLAFTETLRPVVFNDGDNLAVVREFGITLSGRLRHAPAIEHRLHARVDLRNDEIL